MTIYEVCLEQIRNWIYLKLTFLNIIVNEKNFKLNGEQINPTNHHQIV